MKRKKIAQMSKGRPSSRRPGVVGSEGEEIR